MSVRYDYARKRGLEHKGIDARPGGARHTDEMARHAEIWVADLYGLPHPRLLGADPGYDFLLRGILGARDCRLDIKWTPRRDGRLMVAQYKPLSADAYAVVTGPTDAEFTSVGFAWRHQLAERDFGYGKTWYAEQSELRSLDLLMACHGIVRV